MRQHDLAILFLAKAAQGELVVDRLIDDSAVADEAIGFHLQQAAEKLLKAVLAKVGADIGKTHNLAYPIDQVETSGIPFPDDLRHVIELQPFAVEFRYALPDEAAAPLDRAAMRALLYTRGAGPRRSSRRQPVRSAARELRRAVLSLVLICHRM